MAGSSEFQCLDIRVTEHPVEYFLLCLSSYLKFSVICTYKCRMDFSVLRESKALVEGHSMVPAY